MDSLEKLPAAWRPPSFMATRLNSDSWKASEQELSNAALDRGLLEMQELQQEQGFYSHLTEDAVEGYLSTAFGSVNATQEHQALGM